jgi:DNA polymerase III delta prime subunit
MNTTTLPENNTNINIKLFVLDPLSVIIKLAILSNKPVGTKLLIQNNVVYFQEPGIFQSVCRTFFKSNKTDLQYIYNPIQIACQTFLKKEFTQKTPRITNLFMCAQNGLKKLIETYKNCSIITLCLNYYYAIITNHLEQIQVTTDKLFFKDSMTSLYTKEIIDKLNEQWKDENIKVILDLITFLTRDVMAMNNVKSLENIMENIDKNTQSVIVGL